MAYPECIGFQISVVLIRRSIWSDEANEPVDNWNDQHLCLTTFDGQGGTSMYWPGMPQWQFLIATDYLMMH